MFPETGESPQNCAHYLRGVLISQLVRRMNGVTVVDLDQELTADPQRAGTETCPGGQLAR
ncbi:hypothetical protein OG609_10865 [Streptomyces sp. NBC_01224]|uniref:hypothetical protein n=1 Tax=unclassified Streptomyces TaxID=2593676 RepID=UPI002E1459B2|nr:hypothetical protein OG609_10865 [Streptomyces sp. NBC_01224]